MFFIQSTENTNDTSTTRKDLSKDLECIVLHSLFKLQKQPYNHSLEVGVRGHS